jgi:hypothetical protein
VAPAWRLHLPARRYRPLGRHDASGGVWGPGDLLYVTSHHAPEFYVFRLPRAGSVLKLVRIVASPAEGQGVALDPARRRFFQIQRKERAVYEFDLSPLLQLLSRA